MKKFLFLLLSVVMTLTMCACSASKESASKIEVNDKIDVTPFKIELKWDAELIGEDFDIEFVSEDDGSGYKIDKSNGTAVVTVQNAGISFDLTYVWLPPVGVLNNLPKCEAKIYENDELKETMSSDNTDNIYEAPTGAVGFGICSVRNGRLVEYLGDWKELE